jgi:hypothetical protein
VDKNNKNAPKHNPGKCKYRPVAQRCNPALTAESSARLPRHEFPR